MKTGTTYLQGLMDANRQALARAGYLFPGNKWSDQSQAVRDILFESEDPRLKSVVNGQWDRLRTEVRQHDGPASIVSMEFLSFADTDQATRVVESLADVELHVILTVRDAAAAIPAQWQTGCRNGKRISYQRLVHAVRQILNDRVPPHARSAKFFLRTQGIPRMLDVWVPLVGARRVHVITVPPKGSDPMLLWRRFAKVVGVNPKVCSIPPVNSNPSLGLASSELLRRINIGLGKTHPMDYSKVVKSGLGRHVLASRAHLEPPVQLHRDGRMVAARWNGRVREAIRSHGVDLVGSLKDLPVGPPGPDVPENLPAPSDAELLAAAAAARDGMLAMRSSLSAAIGAPGPETDSSGPTQPDRWADQDDAPGVAVAEVTALVRDCIQLHHRLADLARGVGSEAADGEAPEVFDEGEVNSG